MKKRMPIVISVLGILFCVETIFTVRSSFVFQSRIKELESSNTQFQTQISDLTTSNTSLKDNNAKLQTQLADLQKSNDALQSKVTDLGKKNSSLSTQVDNVVRNSSSSNTSEAKTYVNKYTYSASGAATIIKQPSLGFYNVSYKVICTNCGKDITTRGTSSSISHGQAHCGYCDKDVYYTITCTREKVEKP